MKDGAGVSYLGATNRNNAVLDFVERDERLLQKGNCIAFIRNGEGSIGYAVYKAEDFIATSDITLGYAPFLNRYTGMFITTVADRVRGKYSYNYKRSEERLRKEMLQLPIDDTGRPDWAFMESYMREIERVLYSWYDSRESGESEEVSLEGVKWGEFVISDVAEIISGRGIFDEERQPGDIPYITASAMNNGVTYFLSNVNDTLEANCISVNSNGSVGYAFYHPYEALYSGDCRKLRLFRRNKYTALFIATAITHQKDKYNYGYKMGTARLKRQKIQLPITDDGQPDYIFMERFIRSHERKLIMNYINHISTKLLTPPPPQKLLSLKGVNWRSFYLRDIFPAIQRGKRLKTADHIAGNIPYVSSSAMNNGVDDFIGNTGTIRKFCNCITIANSGSVGKAFYHDYEFIASDHVTALTAPGMDRNAYMFIMTAAERLQEKYSFNREINEARINREKIMLPADEHGQPDYDFMSEYTRGIEWRKMFDVLRFFQRELEGRA